MSYVVRLIDTDITERLSKTLIAGHPQVDSEAKLMAVSPRGDRAWQALSGCGDIQTCQCRYRHGEQ